MSINRNWGMVANLPTVMQCMSDKKFVRQQEVRKATRSS